MPKRVSQGHTKPTHAAGAAKRVSYETLSAARGPADPERQVLRLLYKPSSN